MNLSSAFPNWAMKHVQIIVKNRPYAAAATAATKTEMLIFILLFTLVFLLLNRAHLIRIITAY